jgi:hypothetical protein
MDDGLAKGFLSDFQFGVVKHEYSSNQMYSLYQHYSPVQKNVSK